MRLIDIEPLQKEHWHLHRYVAGVCAAWVEEMELEKVPTVDAVPLDKLCEWLSENNMNIPCESCTNFSNGFCTAIGDTSRPCPKTADSWWQAITKWMEEQDADNI